MFGGLSDQGHQTDFALAHLVERVTGVPNHIVDLQEAVVQATDPRNPNVDIAEFLCGIPKTKFAFRAI